MNKTQAAARLAVIDQPARRIGFSETRQRWDEGADLLATHANERHAEIHHATGVYGWVDRVKCWFSDRPKAEVAGFAFCVIGAGLCALIALGRL